jgi:GNAT superfamily N-acetyltransferase
MRVERWTGSKLPEVMVELLRETIEHVGLGEHELEASLGIATSDRGLTFLASDDARPVGVLIAAPDRATGAAFIRWLVVDPNHRRRGVGTALADALAETPEITSLSGMVDQDDPVAASFWYDRGWTVASPRPGRSCQRMGAALTGDRPAAA